ncbi:hypothetical protein N7461_005996 [Penicillium sp. DV-2018c]|nr:hypothetical protein N7461_005996 [Penicillium sp. DV-2018c]
MGHLGVSNGDLVALGLGVPYVDAGQWLTQFAPYMNYIWSVRLQTSISPWNPGRDDLAHMTSSRHHQLQVLQGLAEQMGDDEETVNLSLVGHLTAITAAHPRNERAEWMGHRLELKATLRGAHLRAITVGYLRTRNGRRIVVMALIETKAHRAICLTRLSPLDAVTCLNSEADHTCAYLLTPAAALPQHRPLTPSLKPIIKPAMGTPTPIASTPMPVLSALRQCSLLAPMSLVTA